MGLFERHENLTVVVPFAKQDGRALPPVRLPPSFHFTSRSRRLRFARHALTTAGASRVRAANEPHRRSRLLALNSHTFMTFIEQFERALARMLDSGSADTADIVRWASEKILESYRNGITAGLQGATVKRPGVSRRSGLYGKAKK